MSIVYYRKLIRGRLFPVKARVEGAHFAYAHEVYREGGRVRTKYLGIREVPRGEPVQTLKQPVKEVEASIGDEAQ